MAFSINANCQTTNEEYNYLTKGLKASIENGLDIKNGYKLEKANNYSMGNYNFSFYNFIRNNTDQLAAIGLIANSSVSGYTYYFAIPIENPRLFSQYFNAVNVLDETMTTALTMALSNFLINSVTPTIEEPMEAAPITR